MAKKQRLGINTANVLTDIMTGAVNDSVQIPAGVVLRSEEEKLIWDQFTRIRNVNDWRDFDLLLIAKAVRLEADIRKHQLTLDATGVILTTERGTPVANPLVTIIDSLQRQQLSIITKLSLNQQPVDPRTLNGAGNKQGDYRRLFESADDDLIARPRN